MESEISQLFAADKRNIFIFHIRILSGIFIYNLIYRRIFTAIFIYSMMTINLWEKKGIMYDVKRENFE